MYPSLGLQLVGSLTLKPKTGVNNIPGEFILDDIWSSFYFVPSITVLTLQYSSCWPCFSEIKNKSTANVSIFPSHKIFCGTKEKCAPRMYMFYVIYSIEDQTEEIHRPFKIPTKTHLPLELVQFMQPWATSCSVLAAAGPWHACISQGMLHSTNSVWSFWQLESHGEQNTQFTPISCRYIMVTLRI